MNTDDKIEKNHKLHAVFGLGFAYMTAIKMLTSKVVRTIKK